jgi:subtilase family serine protease
MIKFSRPARPGVARHRNVRLRRWAVAGSAAACAMAACAMAGGAMTGGAMTGGAMAGGGVARGGVAGNGNHGGAASAAPPFADSSALATHDGTGVASASAASPFSGLIGASCLQYPASCYAPGPFRVAYGIQALLDRGIDGRGQTVVVPEVANQPPASPPNVSDIRQDLARFDSLNHIPAARLRVVTTLAGKAAPYLAGFEEVEDVEIVHAVAPEATIVVVLVPPSAASSPANFVKAVVEFLKLAVPRGDVISISASAGEHFFTAGQVAQLNGALQTARDHHVTVVAASGDTGAASDPHFGSAPVKEVSLPASDPLVLAAGGTSLALNPTTGAYSGELAWNTSGGGFSHFFSRPGYQDGIGGIWATRGVPDVAADADPNTGMALAIADGTNDYSLYPAGGTSAATPLWAGVIALADQYAGRPLGFVNPGIYRIGRSAMYRMAFHDITIGDNSVVVVPKLITGYQASPGWDPVTGWGSPDAQVLVPLLAHEVHPAGGG